MTTTPDRPSTEVRTISSTGAAKGVKLARFDLIPVGPLTELAEHYGRGYAKYGDIPISVKAELVNYCTCDSPIATLQALTTLVGCAETAMNATYEHVTLSLLSANGKTPGTGRVNPPTELENVPLTSLIAALSQTTNDELRTRDWVDGPNEDSLLMMARNYLATKTGYVPSAGTNSARADLTWTTTTSQALHEGFFAHVVTKLLDSSETRSMVYGEHSPTCRTHQLISTSNGMAIRNTRNWEKGYEWSLSYAALNRHLTAFWNGEDIDEETGGRHIIAVAWHAFALAEYGKTHPEYDDRPA